MQLRHAVRAFALQVSLGLAMMLAASAAGLQGWPEIGRSASRMFSVYSIIECVRASLRGEFIGGRTVTHWDQAAGYSLCAAMADLLVHWPG